MKPYFTVSGKPISYYGICFIVGFAVALLAAVLRKRKNINVLDLLCSFAFIVIGAIIGSKLLAILPYIGKIISGEISITAFLSGGFVFYGGFLGGVGALALYLKIYKLDFGEFFDLYAVSVPAGHAIGRVGCFISGCCYGIPHDGFLSYVYTYDNHSAPVGVPLLPIQLIEAACLILLFIALEVLYYKRVRRWTCAVVYVYSYAALRFVLEFFRGDEIRGFLFGLSTSQIIALLLVIALTVCLIVSKRRAKRSEFSNA